MPHRITRDTISVRSTAVAVDEKEFPDSRVLHTVLTRTETEERTYFSVISALSPCIRPDEDICIVHDITGDCLKAAKIFHTIAAGGVCPCTLEDVLSDIL